MSAENLNDNLELKTGNLSPHKAFELFRLQLYKLSRGWPDFSQHGFYISFYISFSNKVPLKNSSVI